MAERILPTSSLLGTQSLVVDAQGNGDYTTIQAALNAAAPYASASARWTVRVAPGLYQERLTLKDNVDLCGLTPGRAAHLKMDSGALISTPASCTLADLWLETADAAVLSLGSAFSGALELYRVIIDQAALDIPAISQAGGSLLISASRLASGGAVELSGGSLQVYQSILRNQAGYDGGANMVLRLSHGSLLLAGCLVENVSPAGYAVYIDNSVTSLKAYHSTLRKVDAGYAIHVSGAARAMTLAGCCGNGPLHPNLTGYHDYSWDAAI